MSAVSTQVESEALTEDGRWDKQVSSVEHVGFEDLRAQQASILYHSAYTTEVKFIHQGHQVKVKNTEANTGYMSVTKKTFTSSPPSTEWQSCYSSD